MKKKEYIPALSYDLLTVLYDPVVRLTTRETVFKAALLDQAQISAGQNVLDLACGTATLTIAVKRTHPQTEVVGIDGDPAILRQAEAKVRKAGLEIQLDEGLSFELPYPNESFDRVLSSLFFHHLTRENKVRTFLEVHRVLKPGGQFHIADWGKAHNRFMKLNSYLIQVLDGSNTTSDNFNGLLPVLIKEAGFDAVEETSHFNSLFGTIRLLQAHRFLDIGHR